MIKAKIIFLENAHHLRILVLNIHHFRILVLKIEEKRENIKPNKYNHKIRNGFLKLLEATITLKQ